MKSNLCLFNANEQKEISRQPWMQSQRTNKRSSILQIYDLRREARLREAREWFYKNYFVENLDDWM